MGGDRVDFFVSHAGADRAWAEWVAWQLIDAGYTVELDVWDWAAGQNFVTAMSDALDRCDRVVALFSAAYFDRSRYTTQEWSSAALHVLGGDAGRLVPVRVEEVPAGQIPAVLRPLVCRDVFGVGEEAARLALLKAVQPAGASRPGRKPLFPGGGALARLGGSGPRVPGSMPRTWNVPARNPGFTGRDALLIAVRERLLAGDAAVVQALHGMGGVGKTQLAMEYAYRFAGTYDLAWWVNTEQAELIADQFAALGTGLGCVDPGATADAVRAAVLGELRERGRYLLIFDNATQPGDVAGWLPGGGHVLITTRERGWDEIAAPVEVDLLAWRQTLARLSGQALARVDQQGVQLHRLTQAILRDRLTPGQVAANRSRAEAILAVGNPGDPANPATWTQWAGLMPHLLTVGLADTSNADLRSMACDACEYLLARGQTRAAHDLAARLRQAWRDRLGSDVLTCAATKYLAWALGDMGRYAEARDLDQDALDQYRRLLGDDHPSTLSSASNLAIDLQALGDYQAARDLDQDILDRRRRVLGDDHPHTLATATNLAADLHLLGDYQAARDLHQDTLDRHRRLLGDDHPHTLISANNLAADLQALGDYQAARDLDQDTLDRRRRVIGEDHPDTLTSAGNLAADLRSLGDYQAARDLDQDTLDRRRRVIGEDHPATLRSVSNLAADLRALGEPDDH